METKKNFNPGGSPAGSEGTVPERSRLAEVFKKEHRQINVLLQRMDFSLPRRSLPVFQAFCERIRTHMRMEEDVFFPLLQAGPEHPMKKEMLEISAEHKHLSALMDEIVTALEQANYTGARKLFDMMLRVIMDHERKEQVLFDAILGSPRQS